MRIFCSICKEIFIPYSEIKVTNCGHIYHGACIAQWCTQHKTCPQCRSSIKTQPIKVYFDVEGGETDASTLEHQLETVTDQLREHEISNRKLREENEKYERISNELKECAASFKERNDVLKTTIKTLKEEVCKLSKKNESLGKLQDEVTMWKNKVNSFERIEYLLKGSTDEIKKLVETTPVSSQAVRQLCTYVGVLKVELSKSQIKYDALLKENKNLSKSLVEEKYKNSYELEDTIKNLRLSCSALEKELCCVREALKEEKNKNLAKNGEVTILSDNKVKKQAPGRKLLFDFDIDIIDEPEEKPKKDSYVEEICENIKKWEEMVCAGQSMNYGIGFNKHRSFNRGSNNSSDDEELKRLSANYAFDGLGGRKKIRLGAPTPREEFLKIKRPNKKKTESAPQTNTIIDYYQID